MPTSTPSPAREDADLHRGSDFRIPFQSLRVIFALFVREITTSFGRSKLGYFWTILEPVGGIAVLTLGFSVLFAKPPLGVSFPLFYATGFLPFAAYGAGYAQASTALRNNRILLFYPAVTFIDVIIARLILITITQSAVFVIVMGTILFVDGASAAPEFPRMAASLWCAILFGTVVGLINATLFEVFPSWQNIWTILNRPIFFMSCIFYMFESMPVSLQKFLWWNPLVHIIGLMRTGVYSNQYEGNYISLVYITIIITALATIAITILRYSNKFIMNN